MKPILYESSEVAFTSNGIGILADAISCKVTEERNGPYELVMQYPLGGLHYDEIKNRRVLFAKANTFDDGQPFRIYKITRPLNGIVTVYAQHISYDLSGIVASPFSALNVSAALAGLKANAATSCPFTFWTDKTTAATFTAKTPASIRSLLGGVSGSVLDVYGGEYEFDGLTVKLHGARGADRGVQIRYGKNLTDLTQEENIASVYTGVYPFWADLDGNTTQLPEKIVNAPGTFDFVRIMPLDLSSSFEEQPTEAQLRAKAQAYIAGNRISTPKVSLTVSFEQLANSDEYKHLALLEAVSLCDTVAVYFDRLGVQTAAKCVKVVYDTILERCEAVELGETRANIADTIAMATQMLENPQENTPLQNAISAATQAITGNKGGYVVLHSSTGSSAPDEILIMDTPSIDTAQKVWRWNNGGLGYSNHGYAGPYDTAITQNGEIVADFITTGLLSADLIKSGTITNDLGNLYINVDSGVIRSNDTVYNIGNYTQYSGVSMVQRIKMTDGREIDVTHVGVNPSNTGGQVYVSDKNKNGLVAGMYDKENGTGVLFAFGKDGKAVTIDGEAGTVTATGAIIGSNIDSGGLHYNGRYYYPMDIDFKDSRGANQVMHILCAGLN